MYVELKKSLCFMIFVLMLYTSIALLLYFSLQRLSVYFILLFTCLSTHGYFFIRRYVLLKGSKSVCGIVIPVSVKDKIKLITAHEKIEVENIYSMLLSSIFSIIICQHNNSTQALFISCDMLDSQHMCQLRRYLVNS